MLSTEWVPVVSLLFLSFCFQAVRSQNPPESRLDPASTVRPGSGVTVASQDAFPSLDAVDSSRYQREDSPTGSLTFEEEQWIDSISITIFFPRASTETVTVEGDGFSAHFESSDLDDTRLRECPSPTSTITTECAIDDDWMLVIRTVELGDVCTKTWTLTLGGDSIAASTVSIGEITVFFLKDGCDEDDSALPTAVWAAIGIGAGVLLLIILCVCCWCRRRNKQKGTSAPSSAWQAHEDNGHGQQHEALIAASIPSVQQGHDRYQPRVQPAVSPAIQPLPYQEAVQTHEMSKVPSVPEAVKYSSNVTSTAPSSSQRELNQGVSASNASGKRYPQANKPIDQQQPQHVVHGSHADMGASEDEELDGDPGPGPTMYDATDQEEPIDPQQNAMLKDIHLQQAAGITEMIQGVKENLMNQQTLKHKGGDDGGLEIFNKIGGGGFGEVFKGKYREKEVAVKIMKIKPGARQESLTELPYTEAAIAGICIHQNIVQTMYSDLLPVLDAQQPNEQGGSFWSRARTDGGPSQRGVSRGDSRVKEWQVRMVMEICDLGSVRDWVSPAAGQKYGALYSALPNKAGTKGCGSRTLCALLTSLDVANGMKLLHKYKILHSDLKPHNVLLCSSHTDPRGFIAKLSDFGLSMKMAAHDGQVPGIKYGTVQYLAPEVLNTHIMTKKADVYSFGIIMWEVWHSRLFAEFYNNEKRKRKQAGQSMEDYRPMVSSKCPRTYVHLMTQCLDRNPDKRPDFLGGQVNIVVELERLIYEEYAKMAASAAAQAQ